MYIHTNDSFTMEGYLELFLGPMFSGKTTQLIQIYNTYTYIGKKVFTINFIADVRYHDQLLSSHDKIMIPCIQTSNLKTILNNQEVQSSQVILINEGQFFNDLFDSIEKWLKENKKIYVCGLDGDFERKKFGQILDLIPLCDKITKMTSLCSQCKNGTPGIFSMRLTKEKEQTIVGSDNYIPVCRSCYEKK